MTELDYMKGFINWAEAQGKLSKKDLKAYDDYVRNYSAAKKIVDEMLGIR